MKKKKKKKKKNERNRLEIVPPILKFITIIIV